MILASRDWEEVEHNTNRIFRRLGGEEQKRPDNVTNCVGHEHHCRGDALLREARDIGRDHGQANRESSNIANEDEEAKQLASLVGAKSHKDGADKAIYKG